MVFTKLCNGYHVPVEAEIEIRLNLVSFVNVLISGMKQDWQQKS